MTQRSLPADIDATLALLGEGRYVADPALPPPHIHALQI